ncbi:spermine oxidase-like [Chironomus tepperi]|uniref:spermine oxidase-like n=1 Tax=Chironomus tepperi TaxID=113505 RepID=UPI00391FAD42
MLRNIFFVILIVSSTKATTQPKIIIVGSGLSGLSAAVKLYENGYENILILEAENRIGGRIHTVELSDQGYVDLGAQWVHGMKNNSIYESIVGKYGFGETGFDDHYPIFLQSDGVQLDQEKCHKLADMAMKILFSSYDQMSEFPGSIQDYFISSFVGQTTEMADQMLTHEMIDFFEKEMNIWNGSTTWKDLSASLHCASGHNAGTQHLTWKRDGFFTFIEFMTKQHKDILSKVLFNKQVVNIQWNQNYEYKLPMVSTSDGHKYFADHIIFTASLGVLKDIYRTLFSPQLPKPMIRAINLMGFGIIGKIFLEFDEPFWPVNDDNWVGYGFLWTEEDLRDLKGTDKEWLLDIQVYAKLDAFPNVLESLIAGPHMKEFETLSDEQIVDDSLWLLEKFLKMSVPRPKTMRRTKWLTNPNFLGSYSYNSVNAWKFNITSKDLAQTLYNQMNKPEILFAGEHTDEMYSSNTHGAVNSGFRAANELITYFRQKELEIIICEHAVNDSFTLSTANKCIQNEESS